MTFFLVVAGKSEVKMERAFFQKVQRRLELEY